MKNQRKFNRLYSGIAAVLALMRWAPDSPLLYRKSEPHVDIVPPVLDADPVTEADLEVGGEYAAADGGANLRIIKRDDDGWLYWRQGETRPGWSRPESFLKRVICRVAPIGSLDAVFSSAPPADIANMKGTDGEYDPTRYVKSGTWSGTAAGVSNLPKAKPKRVRIRSKPLTMADIVEGGVYVPKRGNNKTPDFRVTDIEAADGHEGYYTVVCYEREGVENSDNSLAMEEFLSLVSRRRTDKETNA